MSLKTSKKRIKLQHRAKATCAASPGHRVWKHMFSRRSATSLCLSVAFPAAALLASLQVRERLHQAADADDEVVCHFELFLIDEPRDSFFDDSVQAPQEVAQAEGHQDGRDEVDGPGLHATVPLASPRPWSWLLQGCEDAHVAKEHHRHEGDAPGRQHPLLEVIEEHVEDDGREDDSPGCGSHGHLDSKTPVPEVPHWVHHSHKVLQADAALQQRASTSNQVAEYAAWQVPRQAKQLGEEAEADGAAEDLEDGQVELEELPEQLGLWARRDQPHDVAVGGQTENHVGDHGGHAEWMRLNL